MSIDTYAIIKKGTTLPEIVLHIEKYYKNVCVTSTHSEYYFKVNFDDGSDRRNLSVFLKDTARIDYKIDGVLLNLSFWGNSILIMKRFLDEFGGYLIENDSISQEPVPMNISEYEKGKDFSEYDLFVNKIIQKLGYDKLKDALELFNEFTEIKLKLS